MSRGYSPERVISPVDRVMRRIVVTDTGCWAYSGSGNRYGAVRIGSKRDGTARMVKAHRIIYEAVVGLVPNGLELDHLCRNTKCVNPVHLEPVTHRENCLRGHGVGAVAAAKTACRNGHPFDEIVDGARSCSICRRARSRRAQRAYAARLRQAAA